MTQENWKDSFKYSQHQHQHDDRGMDMDIEMNAREMTIRQPEAIGTSDGHIPKAFVPMELAGLSGPLRRYYEEQNELLALWGLSDDRSSSGDHHIGRLETIAIYGSFAANVLLLCIKIYALAVSGSLAMVASVLDSCLDLLSGSMFFLALRIMKTKNKYQYPIGKQRIQPLATVIFACLMGMSALQIVVEAVMRFIEGFAGDPALVTINNYVIGIVVATVSLKIFLAIFCKFVARFNNSMVDAYAQDHINDIVTNSVGIVGMIMAARNHSLWFLDPLAASVISFWIIINWAHTGYEITKQLMGRTANTRFLNYITYLALHHHPAIKAVDTVRAYYMGEMLFAEVHIVLPDDMPLRESHDIGESLESKIEQLDDVERCFVHNDFNYDHSIEHKVN